MRLPRWLYRLPLRLPPPALRAVERVLGVEWIAVTTRGRRTGRPHTVMLDVVGRRGDTRYVQPADGRRAQWVRNVTADPRVTLIARGRAQPARVRDVTGPEGAEVVLAFLRAHPWYGRLIVWTVGYVDRVDLPDDVLRARLLAVPVFAIAPA